MRRHHVLLVAGLAALAALVQPLWASRSPKTTDTVANLPAPVAPAFTVPTPHALRANTAIAEWAPLRHRVAARAAPTAAARVIAELGTSTPEGTTNLVLVLSRARDQRGGLWVRVRLPILPNGSTGWVPRAALGGYVPVQTHLVVDLHRLSATLFRDGRRAFSAPIGIGKVGSPTPRGQFFIRTRLTHFHSRFYGPVAFGTSARSAVLTDWPGGGFVGIHGTNEPRLVPGRVSHGCIRLRNADILRLSKLMPVGTPVTIR